MSLQSFIRVTRFVLGTVVLASAIASLLAAYCLAAIALWILRSDTTASPVVVSPAIPLLQPASPVRLYLPAAQDRATNSEYGRFEFMSQIEEIRLDFVRAGLGFSAARRVIITPIRLALPASAIAVDADFAGYDNWLDEQQEALADDYVPTQRCKVETSALKRLQKTRTESLSQMTITQLRKLAKERGLKGISKLRKAELIAALV